MTINILDSNFQQQKTNEFINDFSNYLDEIFVEFDESYTQKFFSKEFRSEIAKLNHDKNLFEYSPLKFNFAKQLEDALFLAHLHNEISEDPEVEVEIFDFWKDSDFGELFLEKNQEESGQNICKTSLTFKPLLENQILSFYYLHISLKPETQPDLLNYYIQSNLGDTKDRIYITDSHFNVTQKDLFDGGVLEVNCLTNLRSSLEAQSGKDIKAYLVNKEPTLLRIENNSVFINCPSDMDNNVEIFKENCLKALKNIQKFSPNLYECFFQFTNTLIPLSEEGIVSFSSQSLPGYSSLNVTDRDFIELHDDLLHENGHHFLNTILNVTELIDEDDEQIFYSPWRKARRPIRGIYHAYFTFYWAFQLFHDLSNALINDIKLDGITKSDLSRCARRAKEEYLMLEYTFQDLLVAKEMGKITDDGFKVLDLVDQNLKSLKESMVTIDQNISSEDQRIIQELTQELVNQKKENPF